MSSPPPILWMPIFTGGDEHRSYLLDTLALIRRDDPAVLVQADPDSGALLFSGTSLEHLQQTFDKVTDEYRVPVWKGEPRVRYIETIQRTAEGEGKYIHQTGGSGNYGHVKLRLEPGEPGNTLELENELQGGVVPEPYIAPIEEGVREAALAGILAGHELTGLRVTLYDGSFHELDSNSQAFRTAASLALQDAARKANPIVLEPVMSTFFIGRVSYRDLMLAAIRSMGGREEEARTKRDTLVVRATVPLREILNHDGGAARIMQFSKWEPVLSGPDEAHPAGSAVRNPWNPRPRTGSAAADPEFDIGSDWT